MDYIGHRRPHRVEYLHAPKVSSLFVYIRMVTGIILTFTTFPPYFLRKHRMCNVEDISLKFAFLSHHVRHFPDMLDDLRAINLHPLGDKYNKNIS